MEVNGRPEERVEPATLWWSVASHRSTRPQPCLHQKDVDEASETEIQEILIQYDCGDFPSFT